MKKYKNYIILIIILAISIIGCVYALKWHAVYKAEKLNTTIITDYIHELKTQEFMNYIGDNPYAVIYFGVTSDDNCRRFEKQFKNFIIDRSLSETVVYVNVNAIVGNDFNTKLDTIYNTKKMRDENKYFKGVPAVAVYEHTTLVDFVSGSNLTVEKVGQLLDKYHFNGE